MRRREFLGAVGGATVWPIAAAGQQTGSLKRIGIFAPYSATDPQREARIAAFRKGLEHLGWIEGRNVAYAQKFAPAGEKAQDLAKELLNERPDVILGMAPPLLNALRREAGDKTGIPIAFIGISDPIGGGLVASLAKPGGNMTGLLNYEPAIVGKWLAMLREIAPTLSRATLLGNPKTTAFDYYFRAAEAATRALKLNVVPSRVADAQDIERSLDSFARAPNGGLVVLPDATAILHRDLILKLAEHYRLPAVFPFRFLFQRVGSCLMAPSTRPSSAKSLLWWTASCGERNRLTCQFRLRSSMKRSSTSKLQER